MDAFFQKSNKIFEDLLNLANSEFKAKGIEIEPCQIVDKVISPLKDLFSHNLNELLNSFLTGHSDKT